VELFADTTFDTFCELLYTCSMKQMMTAKLKLHTVASQFLALRKTQLAYRDALNYVSRYSFARGKKSNQEASRCFLHGLREAACSRAARHAHRSCQTVV
jgi:hypothetical protein